MDFDTDPLCVIGSDLTLSGKVESAKDLVIYGRVEGIVVSKGRVNISETGIVEGIVSGEKIFIAGHARGKIGRASCRERV